jgi:hypothetical protein
MNDAPREHVGPTASVLLFIGGMGLFWVFDLAANIFAMGSNSVVTGALFLLVVLGGAVAAFRGGLRSFAAGIVAGYALVGILSSGTCILLGKSW